MERCQICEMLHKTLASYESMRRKLLLPNNNTVRPKEFQQKSISQPIKGERFLVFIGWLVGFTHNASTRHKIVTVLTSKHRRDKDAQIVEVLVWSAGGIYKVSIMILDRDAQLCKQNYKKEKIMRAQRVWQMWNIK